MCISNDGIRAINEVSMYLESSFSNQITCKNPRYCSYSRRYTCIMKQDTKNLVKILEKNGFIF